MAIKDFAVFDSDSHVVEPPELWEKYLDPEYRTLGKHALWRQEGRTGAYLKVNGEMFRDQGLRVRRQVEHRRRNRARTLGRRRDVAQRNARA